MHAAPATAHDPQHGAPRTIDARTTVEPRIDRSGYRVTRAEEHGATVVVTEHRGAGNAGHVVAYRETVAGGGEVVARLYADGHRVVQGANFRSEGVAGRAQYVTYTNGLHAAYQAGGQPLYAERYASIWSGEGPPLRVRQRLYYQPFSDPDGGIRWIPSLRSYPWVATIAGIELFAYLAPAPVPGYYRPLYRPAPAPIVVGPGCNICPTPEVSFEAPPQTYQDPLDLVGDRVIGAAATTTPAAAPPASDAAAPPPPADPIIERAIGAPPPAPELVTTASTSPAQAAVELAALRGTTQELQGQVDRQAAATPALADGLPQVHAMPAVLFEAANGAAAGSVAGAPLVVPREAQEQLRKEVRYAVALQRNQHSLQLPEILQAPFGKIFVFQATVPIDVTWPGNVEQCTLGSGDLIDFAHAPAADATLVDMHVISSRTGHCPAGAAVQLGTSDLQDMLNSFSEHVEVEAKTVNACLSPGGACIRT
jgi:hypothetical protein